MTTGNRTKQQARTTRVDSVKVTIDNRNRETDSVNMTIGTPTMSRKWTAPLWPSVTTTTGTRLVDTGITGVEVLL
jgi:hypothetical protein